MSARNIVTMGALIIGSVWTLIAGFYFALIFALQFPHGAMFLLGGIGIFALGVAAALHFWPKPDADKLPRKVTAVVLSEDPRP